MAAGGGAGVVTVWDLEARRLSTVIRGAHDAPLSSLHFMPGGAHAKGCLIAACLPALVHYVPSSSLMQ